MPTNVHMYYERRAQNGAGLWEYSGEFTIGATGAPTVVAAPFFTFTRIGVGRYTVQIVNSDSSKGSAKAFAYAKFVVGAASGQPTNGSGVHVYIFNVLPASGSFDVQFSESEGGVGTEVFVDTDPFNGAKLFIYFVARMS